MIDVDEELVAVIDESGAVVGWMTQDELRERLVDRSWPVVPDGRALLEAWYKRVKGLLPDVPDTGDGRPTS